MSGVSEGEFLWEGVQLEERTCAQAEWGVGAGGVCPGLQWEGVSGDLAWSHLSGLVSAVGVVPSYLSVSKI